MPNIFDGVRKMTEEEIRLQIAFLKNVTWLNVAKETGNKMIGGLTEIANAFTEAFSRKTPFSYQITKVADMVDKDYVSLKIKERVQLEYELKMLLFDKCKELGEGASVEVADEERLSLTVINAAAKGYGIERYKTPANKIKELSIEYNNTFLQELHEYLVRQNESQAAKTDKAIQNRLNEISQETRRMLQQALMPKEFSGKGIGRILRLEKKTKYLSSAVTFLGADCFDYTAVNIVTVLHAVRSLKRVQRILLAQFVWKAATAYGQPFTIAKDLLPSFVPDKELSQFQEMEKEFRALLEGRIQSEKELSQCELAIEKSEKQIAEQKDRQELAQRDYDEIQMQFMSLESRKDEFMAGLKPEAETKEYYNQVNETKRRLDKIESEFQKIKNKTAELEKQRETLENNRSAAAFHLQVSREKTRNQVTQRCVQLRSSWTAYYYKFQFENEIFERLVIDFMNSEILCIEEMLKEMHDSKRLEVFADEKDEEISKTMCNTAPGKNAVITYSGKRITSISRL